MNIKGEKNERFKRNINGKEYLNRFCRRISGNKSLYVFCLGGEKRYLALLENVEKDRVFNRASVEKWKCSNCGYIHEGTEAPEECPSCAHPRAHFELLCENY